MPHRWHKIVLQTLPLPRYLVELDREKDPHGLFPFQEVVLTEERCTVCNKRRRRVARQVERGGSFNGLGTVGYVYLLGNGWTSEKRVPACSRAQAQ